MYHFPCFNFQTKKFIKTQNILTLTLIVNKLLIHITKPYNFINKFREKAMQKIFERQSSGQIRNGNRRYIKRGVSPEQTRSGSSNFHSNKQSFSKLAAQVYHQASTNGRYNERSRMAYSKDQIKSKEESLINIELLGLSSSKNFIGDRRKKGKSSFYKKAPDLSNHSDIFLGLNQRKQTGVSHNSHNLKNSAQSESSLQHNENQVEQLHYKMVQFQQKCKNMIVN